MDLIMKEITVDDVCYTCFLYQDYKVVIGVVEWSDAAVIRVEAGTCFECCTVNQLRDYHNWTPTKDNTFFISLTGDCPEFLREHLRRIISNLPMV